MLTVARRDHQDALAATALHRLDHKRVAALQQVQHAVDLELVLNHAVEFRHDNIALQGGLLGQQLVVDNLVVAPGIIGADEREIALVHAEDAPLPQDRGFHQPNHCIFAMSRNRYSSESR